jgi:predicted AlkP superfamily phosphohydrolase/phosphomutase
MNGPKTLLIGLDGGTFTVLDALAAEGVIPNLAKLMRDGARGVLRSTVPPISAPAWATFQTGKHPGKHGLFNFFDLSEGGYRQSHDFRSSRVVNHSNIGSATLYDYLREGGRKVISVNVPLTYPTPEVEGCVVACWLTPPGSGAFTHPRELAAELPDYRIDQNFGEGMYAVTPRGKELDSDYLFDDLEDILRRRADAAEYLLTSKPWDLGLICFTETDRVHHYFWRAFDPARKGGGATAEHERERFRAFYRELDARVGRLMAAAGAAANTLVVSDHGFDSPPPRRYHLSHWMREQGWLTTRPATGAEGETGAEAPAAPSPAMQGSAFRAARAVWRALVPSALRERVYAGTGYAPQRLEVDWERTRAWSFGVNNNLGAVCVNVREEGTGCVEPGAETERLVDEIAEGLKRLTDPATGAPVVRQVMRREEVFAGPYVERFPHLLVLLDPGFEADVESGYALGPERIEAGPIYPNGRGNHRPEGICIAAGPDIVPGPKAEQSLASVMPTLLHLCGLAVPPDLDGAVMAEYLTPEALGRGAGAGEAAEHRFAEPSDEDVRLLQEKLKHLGYM